MRKKIYLDESNTKKILKINKSIMTSIVIFVLLAIVIVIIVKSNGSISKHSDNNFPYHRDIKNIQSKEIEGEAIKRTLVKDPDLKFEKSPTNIPEIIVFDIETTGLADLNKNVTASNALKYPRIVQIAWMVFDKNMRLIKEECHIIKQCKCIPQDSINIHGITNEMARDRGEEIREVLALFDADLITSKVLVAHNMEFDYKVTKSEYIRNDMDRGELDKIGKACTMLMSKDFCALERYGNDGYKYPSLYEMYRECFPEKILHKKMLHNALVDVAVCAKSLERMNEIGAI